MKLKFLNALVVTVGLLVPATLANAQSAYYQAVTALSPVGYWPMHEIEPNPHGDIETNYGTVGTLATGFYGDWATLNNTPIVHGQPGCIVNDSSETAVHFTQTSGSPSTGGFTNGLVVPHTSPLTTLKPPFSVECWMNGDASGNKQADIWSQAGGAGLNNGPNLAGIRLHWGNVGWVVYSYNGASGSDLLTLISYNTGISANTWYHTVVTDDGTNITLWINGAPVGTAAQAGNYAPDSWTPLAIDNGVGGGNPFRDSMKGYIDEFAVYTNALTPDVITNHYELGETGTATTYFNSISSASPAVYFLMNSPTITTEPVGADLVNNGSSGINGAYRPEVLPGGVSGPGAFGAGFGSTNAMPGNGCDGFADVGNSTSYNPTGTGASFSITAWFQGNPADARNQTIVGHGTNSWQLAMLSSGKIAFNAGTNSAATVATGGGAGDLVSPGVYNDGFWHQAVATHNGSVNVLYLDGSPIATNSTTANIPGSAADVLIGADPSFTNNPTQGEGRQFAGNICEVAFFASTLTAGQVQSLYAASDLEPVITQQPVSASVNAGIAFTNSVTAIGVGPLSYQWYTNGTAFGGATASSLAINPVQPVNAGSYYVIVGNSYGSATSAVVNLTVQSAPILSGQFPITYSNILNTNFMTLYAGASPTFSISSSGEQPIYYLWFTNGVADGAATNASLTVTNVPVGSLSDYCILSNVLGAATSVVWSASVVSDPVNGAGPAPYPQAVLSLNPIAYWRLNESDNGSGNNGSIAFDYVGGNDGLYTNVILGQPGYNSTSDPSDTSLEVGVNPDVTNSYVGLIGTNIDFSAPSGKNAEFSVECWANVSANGGGIVAKGFGNGGEEIALDTGGTRNAFRFYLRPNGQNTTYVANSSIAPNGGWYHLAAVCDEANGNLSLYVNGALAGQTNIPPKSGIVNDIPMNMTIGVRSSSSGSGNNLQSVGTINDVAVFNYALTAAQVANEYNQSGIAPYFIQQPALTYAGQGSNVTVTAVPAGTLPLSYQWYETNLTAMTGHAVSGQTNASLALQNVQSGDDYYLNVVNPYGSTNSSVAPLVVYSSPIVTGWLPVTYTNVVNINFMTLYAGANPAFSVSALGIGALSYQWFTNGVPVGGAAGTNVTLAAVGSGMLTNSCVITSLLGAATNTWIASVLADPTNQSGGLAFFPQTVLALNPSGYWRLNEPDDQAGDGNPGVVCHDYAGGNNGIYTNILLSNPGYNPVEDPSDTSGQFYYFNTENCDANSILAPDVSAPNGVNAEFTVEAWVNPTAPENGGTAVGIAAKGYFNQEEFSLDCGASGNGFRFEVRDAAGTVYNAGSTLATSTSGNLNQWYHLVGVCDEANGVVLLYTNGQLAASAAIPAASGVLNSSSTPMTIGARASSATSGNNNQFIGYINDVAVFNHALTAGQVAAEYAAVSAAAPFFTTTPPTNSGAGANTTLNIPAMAGGTPPLSYAWTNLTTGATLASGTVASAAVLNAALSVNNVPLTWNGNQLELVVNNPYGTTNAFVTLSITNMVNLNPTNIVFATTNNQLALSWPSDHVGWQLQVQANSVSVGLSTNWVDLPGSAGTNQVFVPINLTNGSVFYRLVYP
ncbi:MAG TPA: LamG-like jellyroll fold domain-containing protein [Verrucomicrobiae bacterium]|jgi:prepilin-type processing-associated H-X9-DG protein|nr:LamG-like jellyroll fold domain-containing protein [Verrucomicrobiae bacterium]